MLCLFSELDIEKFRFSENLHEKIIFKWLGFHSAYIPSLLAIMFSCATRKLLGSLLSYVICYSTFIFLLFFLRFYLFFRFFFTNPSFLCSDCAIQCIYIDILTLCANVTGCIVHQRPRTLITMLSICLVFVYNILDAPCFVYMCRMFSVQRSMLIPNVISKP